MYQSLRGSAILLSTREIETQIAQTLYTSIYTMLDWLRASRTRSSSPAGHERLGLVADRARQTPAWCCKRETCCAASA